MIKDEKFIRMLFKECRDEILYFEVTKKGNYMSLGMALGETDD